MGPPQTLRGIPGSLVAAALWRGLLLWVGVRLLVRVFTKMPFQLEAAAAIGVLIIVVVVAYADVRRRREEVMLTNLGISGIGAGLVLGAPAFICEVLMQLLARQAA